MIKLILAFHDEACAASEKGADVEELSNLPVREKIGRFKYIPESEIDEEYKKLRREISNSTDSTVRKEEI